MPGFPSTVMAGLRRHGYAVLLALVAAVVAVPFLAKADSQFDNVYLRAARRLQQGADIYPLQDGYLYPPLMAWLAIPWTWIPPATARGIWFAVNVGCLALLLRWSWRASGGGPLEVGSDWREHQVCWLGLACGFRFALDCLQNQQTDLVIAALALSGCGLLAPGEARGTGRRMAAVAGTLCLGLAAGMKGPALLFAPYLAWRGRWLAAAGVAGVAVGCNLLPDLTHPAADGSSWLGEWVRRYLALLARPDHSPGVWGSAVELNQSWSGAVYRWLATTWVWDAQGLRIEPRPPLLSPLVMKGLVYGAEAAAVIGVAAVLGRAGTAVEDARQHVCECGIVLLLMVLLSPMSSKPHFVVLLLPAWIVARQMAYQRDGASGLLLGLAIVSAGLTIKDLATPPLATLALWYGGVSGSASFLLAALVRLRLAERRRGADNSSRAPGRTAALLGPESLPAGKLTQPVA